jgi:prephenate dehydratase
MAEVAMIHDGSPLWYRARQDYIPTAKPTAGESDAGMKIAIQGEPGSFSHEAALKLVPEGEIVPCPLSAEVFRALDEGEVEAAVIPIENSLAGSVLEHFDLLLTHDVRVERETLLRIRHNLIAPSGVALDEIERVYSHPVALAQCRRFLAAHPAMKAQAAYDTAGSVKQVVEAGDRRAAAIASEAAALHYGAHILASGVEDNPENFTRFFLVRRAAEAKTEPNPNKMSLAFSVKNRPGSLVVALVELAAMGTNLTKIESRPVHGKPWEYSFFVDCQIRSEEEGERAVETLRPHCAMIKELGCYRGAES